MNDTTKLLYTFNSNESGVVKETLYDKTLIIKNPVQPDHRLFPIKIPGDRPARYRLKLEEYDCKIEYKPGKINKHANALSNIDLFKYLTRNYALTVRDELTKLTRAYPIEDKKDSTVLNTLLVFFQHYSTPLRIHRDNGREFENALLKDLCELYDIKLTLSSVN